MTIAIMGISTDQEKRTWFDDTNLPWLRQGGFVFVVWLGFLFIPCAYMAFGDWFSQDLATSFFRKIIPTPSNFFTWGSEAEGGFARWCQLGGFWLFFELFNGFSVLSAFPRIMYLSSTPQSNENSPYIPSEKEAKISAAAKNAAAKKKRKGKGNQRVTKLSKLGTVIEAPSEYEAFIELEKLLPGIIWRSFYGAIHRGEKNYQIPTYLGWVIEFPGATPPKGFSPPALPPKRIVEWEGKPVRITRLSDGYFYEASSRGDALRKIRLDDPSASYGPLRYVIEKNEELGGLLNETYKGWAIETNSSIPSEKSLVLPPDEYDAVKSASVAEVIYLFRANPSNIKKYKDIVAFYLNKTSKKMQTQSKITKLRHPTKVVNDVIGVVIEGASMQKAFEQLVVLEPSALLSSLRLVVKRNERLRGYRNETYKGWSVETALSLPVCGPWDFSPGAVAKVQASTDSLSSLLLKNGIKHVEAEMSVEFANSIESIPHFEMVGQAGVYAFTNKASGLIYIGSTNDLHKRVVSHICEKTEEKSKGADYWQNEFRRQGLGAFRFFVLMFVTRDPSESSGEFDLRLKMHEQSYLDNIIDFDGVYNVSRQAGAPVWIDYKNAREESKKSKAFELAEAEYMTEFP